MDYLEFKKTYAWTVENFSNTVNVYQDDFGSAHMGKLVKTKYERVGKGWKETSRTTEDFTPATYFRTIDAVPWFRQHDGIERIYKSDTVFGRIPTKVSSITPDRQRRIVYEFKFI